MNNLKDKLLQITDKVFQEHPLKPYTTMQVGGPADFVVIAESQQEIIDTILLCKTENIPVKILGCGSNVVISDKGFKGVIIINKSSDWQIVEESDSGIKPMASTAKRYSSYGDDFYTTEGLDYSDNDSQAVHVKVASGVRVIPFIKALLQKDITGLQWFSGIPATVGGAIYMNMHGGNYFFGDFVHSAVLFNGSVMKRVGHDYFQFDYDHSILHETREIILTAELLLFYGDVQKAKTLSVDWARRKSLQPQKSAGCIFQNLTADEQAKLNLPTPSIGYVIDKILNLKGQQKGDAIISASHAAFIENLGQAKAKDIYYLYQLIFEQAKQKLGITLKSEIEFIGEF